MLRIKKNLTSNKFCLKRQSSDKCKKFYDCKDNGLKECPYGYNVYFSNKTIYNSMLIEGLYNDKKIRGRLKNNQVDSNIKIGKEYLDILDKINELESLVEIQNFTEHDLSNLTDNCYELIDIVENDEKYKNDEHYNDYIKTCSNLKLFFNEFNQEKASINILNLKTKDELVKDYELLLLKSDNYSKLFNNVSSLTTSIQKMYNEYKKTGKKGVILSLLQSFEILEYRLRYYNKVISESFDAKVSEINIHANVKKLVEMFRYYVNKKGVSINFQPCTDNCSIRTRDDIYLGIYLIIENAKKYSTDNSVIDISIIVDEENIKITISNTYDKSTVLPEENQLYIKGYRGNSPKKGSGLGLYYAKEIINYCNGTIHIDSKEKFNVTITLSKFTIISS